MKKPLILFIIEIPFIFAVQIWKILTLVPSVPLMLFTFILKPFLFSKAIDKSPTLIAIFCIPRLVLLFCHFALPLGCIGFGSYMIYLEVLITENKPMWVALLSSISSGIFLILALRSGIKRIIRHFPTYFPTRQQFEHALNINFFIFLSILFSLLTCCMLIRLHKLLKYAHPQFEAIRLRYRLYSAYAAKQFLLSFVSWLMLLLSLILVILPWRLYQTIIEFKQASNKWRKQAIVTINCFQSLIDFLVAPLSLIIFLTFYRSISFAQSLNIRKANLWRSSILTYNFKILCDLPYIILILLLTITVYKIVCVIIGLLKHKPYKEKKLKSMLLYHSIELIAYRIPLIIGSFLFFTSFVLFFWNMGFVIRTVKAKFKKRQRRDSSEEGENLNEFLPSYSLKRIPFGDLKFVWVGAFKLLMLGLLELVYLILIIIGLAAFWNIPRYIRLMIKASKNVDPDFYYLSKRIFCVSFLEYIYLLSLLLLTIVTPWRLYSYFFFQQLTPPLNERGSNYSLLPPPQSPRRGRAYEARVRIRQILKYPSLLQIFYFLFFGLLDIILVPFMILQAITLYRIPWLIQISKIKLCPYSTLHQRSEQETHRFMLLLNSGVVVLQELFLLFAFLLLLVFFWRIIFYIFGKNRSPKLLKYPSNRDMDEWEKISQRIDERHSHINGHLSLICESFCQGFLDLPFIIILILTLLTPWRLAQWFSTFVFCVEPISFHNYIEGQSKKRRELYYHLLTGFIDIFVLIIILMSWLLLWRFPLFVYIAKNKPWKEILIENN